MTRILNIITESNGGRPPFDSVMMFKILVIQTTHHHRIKWRAPALRPVRIGERCVQFRAKRLEFHRSLECLELVTEIAQPLQSIIDIEKSRLPSHRIISDPSVTMESERRRIGEVLRSIQVAAEGSSGMLGVASLAAGLFSM